MTEEIEEMRRQVQAHDTAMERERGLSSAMMSALGTLPFHCNPDGTLPAFAPSGGTLRALDRRGLAHVLDGVGGQKRWSRTLLGESVWANR